MNVKDIRRENMRALADTIGGITAMAERLNRSQSQISHVIGTNPVKNIGHKLAAEVEQAFSKPNGWLDVEHHSHINEEETEYVIMPKFYWAPVVSWGDIFKLLAQDKASDINFIDKIPLQLRLSQRTFALQLDQDLVLNKNYVFPKGAIIVVDPEFKPRNHDLVLTYQKGWLSPQIHRLVIVKETFTLKAVQEKSVSYQIQDFTDILGVLRKIEYTF